MHIVAVQPDIIWEDKAANHAAWWPWILDADIPAGSFVLLPELGDTGFSFNLDVHDDDDLSLRWGASLALALNSWVQIGYARRGPDGKGRNCTTILTPDGTPAGTFEKIHPFSFGREVEFFAGGDHILLRTCGDAVVCPKICYDLRFPELWRLGALAGAEVFTIGASWPAPRQEHWRSLLIARAIENQACVVAVNRVGTDPHLAYAGGSMIIGPQGEILAEAGSSPVILQAELPIADLRTWRAAFPALQDVRPDLLGSISVDADQSFIDKSSPS